MADVVQCRGARRFESKTMAPARKVTPDGAISRDGRAIEQQALDADVVMEPFEMPQARVSVGAHVRERGIAGGIVRNPSGKESAGCGRDGAARSMGISARRLRIGAVGRQPAG